MAENEVRANFDGLKKLIGSFRGVNDMRVKVGILSNKASRNAGDGETNVSIGAKHEFGSYSEHIPQRSFLKMPLEKKSQEIARSAIKTIAQDMVNGDLIPTLKILGIAGEAAVADAFKSGGFGQWKPISTMTAELKGSTAILIETSQLQRSITSAVVKKGE
jgi:phage gpG-like protein